ncbi:hypothetical protein CDD81_7724 [Ophiocordyceps australis]|uniref:Uncharacterized protein n=1 Tax=Ophiocordyceps australis TaxID=1399860 RepID=A0A2C5X8W9_9HYPO|nr:hypothetical protein CDD81_7724 [Ophiocordyceps australis]
MHLFNASARLSKRVLPASSSSSASGRVGALVAAGLSGSARSEQQRSADASGDRHAQVPAMPKLDSSWDKSILQHEECNGKESMAAEKEALS